MDPFDLNELVRTVVQQAHTIRKLEEMLGHAVAERDAALHPHDAEPTPLAPPVHDERVPA